MALPGRGSVLVAGDRIRYVQSGSMWCGLLWQTGEIQAPVSIH